MLYNLGSGSWLALAILLQLAAPIACTTDFGPAVMQPDVLRPVSLLRPSPPLRWWSRSLLSYVRVILVIGSGTRASLFTFITYITQYTSHGSRRHISAPQIQLWCWHCAPYKCSYYYYYYYYHRISFEILQPRRCYTISCIALSFFSLCWPQPITAVVRHVRQHAPPTYPYSAFMGSFGQRYGAVNHWHRPSPCICNYVTLTQATATSAEQRHSAPLILSVSPDCVCTVPFNVTRDNTV